MAETPKKVAELTQEEAMAELEAHRAAGINVPEFTPDANVTALRRLVTNARKESASMVKEDPAPNAPVEPEVAPVVKETVPPAPAPETAPTPEPVPEAPKEEVAKPVALDFVLVEGPIRVVPTNGKPSRVYSYQSHGSVYKTLAKNYADANGGTIG